MNSTREMISTRFVRSDESILADIWTALWREDTVRSIDWDSISVKIQDGEVFLAGHVAREQNRQLVEGIVRAVPGVTAVNNQIIADRDLIVEVAQALAEDERTRPYILRVGSFHGWISLGGEVPTREVQSAAEEVAGQVPSVRGVLSLPKVTGERQNPGRRAVQPQIGASAYGEQGQVGVVTQVVVNPRNRLVSNVVISANYEAQGWPVLGDTILPVEAIEHVNPGSIFLVRDGLPLSACPAFDSAEYPRAPLTWRPPYPYAPGAVRWPLEELPGEERKPGIQVGLDFEILPGRTPVDGL